MIYFTSYAVRKFEILKKYQVNLDKENIKEVIEHSQKNGRKGNNFTAEKDNIKVIYKKEDNIIKIITFYPT